MVEEVKVVHFHQTKICPKCSHQKPLAAFHKSAEYGTQGYCKNCTRKYMHDKWREKHPEIKMNIPDRETHTKRCSKCGETKSWDEYYLDKKRDLPEPKCKKCVLKLSLQRRLRDTEAYRLNSWHRTLRRKYAMTPMDYATRLAEQGGKCKLCRTTDAGRKFGFVVDHNHSTGVVRGLLCCKCNAGLGMFDDDPDRMHAAIKYLIEGI